MQFSSSPLLSLSLLLLAGTPLAAAQTTSTTVTTPTTTSASSTATDTSVAALVSSLPHCALSCFASAAHTIGCGPEDFGCLCSSSKSDQLITNMAPCIALSSGCSSSDVTKASQVAPQICAEVNGSPNSADLASASNIVASALATASVTSTTSSGFAARRTDGAIVGAVGAAALLAGVVVW